MSRLLEKLVLNDLLGIKRIGAMNGPDFFQTPMGRKFYEHDVPELVKSLGQIGDYFKLLTDSAELNSQKTDASDAEIMKRRLQTAHDFADEVYHSWKNKFKDTGAVPYADAKSVLIILMQLQKSS